VENIGVFLAVKLFDSEHVLLCFLAFKLFDSEHVLLCFCKPKSPYQFIKNYLKKKTKNMELDMPLVVIKE